MKHVLITGGAGFIGSHVADELLANGYRIRVLDGLDPQVHGEQRKRPDYLAPDVEVQVGDVCDKEAVRKALQGIDAVFHFAAAVGVGQSMYELAHYTRVNNLGTAVLLEQMIQEPGRKLVVASSMSLYGEGLYRNTAGQACEAGERSLEQLKQADWELHAPDGSVLMPVPTPETKPPALASIYALSKYDQERMCLMTGRAYNFPAVALRFFNAYGPRQALSNPYTGVLAIFASRLLNGSAPKIFEDGLQQRDFVSVYDVARGCRLALESQQATGDVFNIGSGRPLTVRDVAGKLAQVMGKQGIEPEIVGKYRVGDIRHCFADISRARRVLGYEPQVTIEDGMAELAAWLEGQAAVDRVSQAAAELARRGLTV
ncbi:NAD-dependent epimerase/dehydratase family protein [Ramlibacter algicola]|uniref:NAD-dependent epimerase/dehydratase family protein n=1 Tax=Ramlibacter algicola TaxID=2795217 RepID=A0A934Q4I0_9BURK|nr:NAD-dependent epimerase/dehydratase family protein [Ramlibacter algicola]MBK0394062.1 NAD-dependent epimerase/dehydratase family protein [Ramlibacter algicola]